MLLTICIKKGGITKLAIPPSLMWRKEMPLSRECIPKKNKGASRLKFVFF